MSLRRSTRKTVQATTTLPESIEKKAIKRIATTKKPVSIKKVKYEVKQNPNFLIPPNWEIVYNKLEAFRDIEEAPVDTMGCERLAQTTAPPKVSNDTIMNVSKKRSSFLYFARYKDFKP
jgi:endonuclease-3